MKTVIIYKIEQAVLPVTRSSSMLLSTVTPIDPYMGDI